MSSLLHVLKLSQVLIDINFEVFVIAHVLDKISEQKSEPSEIAADRALGICIAS